MKIKAVYFCRLTADRKGEPANQSRVGGQFFAIFGQMPFLNYGIREKKKEFQNSSIASSTQYSRILEDFTEDIIVKPPP